MHSSSSSKPVEEGSWNSNERQKNPSPSWSTYEDLDESDNDECKPLFLDEDETEAKKEADSKFDHELLDFGQELRQTMIFGCVGGFLLGCFVAYCALVSLGTTAAPTPIENGGNHLRTGDRPLDLPTSPLFPTDTPAVEEATVIEDWTNDPQEEAPNASTAEPTESTPEKTHEPPIEATTTPPPQTEVPPAKDDFVLGKTTETFRSVTLKLAQKMEVLIPEKPLDSPGVCRKIRKERKHSNLELMYNDTQPGCRSMYGRMGGTGNEMLEYAGKRIMTFAEGNSAFLFDCGFDAFKERSKFVFSWISGYYPIVHSASEAVLGAELPPKEEFDKLHCPSTRRRLNGNKLPIKYVLPLIRHQLRRMAIAMVGIPGPNHPSAAFAQQYLIPEAKAPPYAPTKPTGTIYRIPIHDYYENGPLYPDVELDDVVIHFRCGDILTGAYGPFYFPKYEEYAKFVSPEARSVGIVTQPFNLEDGVQARKRDNIATSGARCKILVEGLIEYLKPRVARNARFSIHNGPGETIPLAYARLIMANQTFGLFPSTFATFPVSSSFGTGYVTKPPKRSPGDFAGHWLSNDMTDNMEYDHLVQVDIFEKMLYCQTLKRMWDEGNDKVLKWFRDVNV